MPTNLPKIAHITTDRDIQNGFYELLAYVSAAERAGVIQLPDFSNILDLNALETSIRTAVAALPAFYTFVAEVGVAIGAVPIVSDALRNTLNANIKDEVTRAAMIQNQRASMGLNLTPAISLIIAQANDKAGKDANYSILPSPFGTPNGAPVTDTPWIQGA